MPSPVTAAVDGLLSAAIRNSYSMSKLTGEIIMKRKIFVNGDMTGKGTTKLVVIQYKKDKFAGYIYGDIKNEKKSFTASSVEKIEKDSNWKWIGPWEVVKHPKATVYNLGEDGIPAPSVQSERYAHCSEELRKYCTTPGRCKLALHLLAGPIERLYAKGAGGQYTGSSIMQIDLKKNANTNGVERAAAYSFARDLSGKNVHWKLKLPVYMPENNRMPRIKDNAYIKDTCGKKLRFSAVYPDGAVVLDNRVLETTDTVKLIHDNPHCMVVLIGARPTKLGNMSVEVITAEELGATSVDWDTECLHWMTQAFSAEAAQRHKVKPAVQWAKGMVDEKLESSNQRFDSKLYATELYLTTAYLLIDFLRSEDNLNPTEEAELCNLLYNAVLPGCYTPPTENGVVQQAIPLTEANFEDAAKQTLSHILKDISRYRFVSQGEACPAENELEQIGVDGFLRMFDTDKAHKTQVPSVLFYKQTFARLFKEQCPYHCEDEKLLDKLLSAFGKGKLLNCCPVRDVSKDRFGDKSPVASVRLLVDRLDFLSEEKLEELKQAFQVKD